MKTILHIIIILLVASVVAEAFSLAVNNTSSTSEDGGAASVTNAGGQVFQPTERPEGGDHDEGSLAGGLSGVLMTVAKLTGVTILVLLVQRAFGPFTNRNLVFTRQ